MTDYLTKEAVKEEISDEVLNFLVSYPDRVCNIHKSPIIDANTYYENLIKGIFNADRYEVI